MNPAKKPFDPAAACPLDGIRVVDLSRLVAGNAVSSQLAQSGWQAVVGHCDTQRNRSPQRTAPGTTSQPCSA